MLCLRSICSSKFRWKKKFYVIFASSKILVWFKRIWIRVYSIATKLRVMNFPISHCSITSINEKYDVDQYSFYDQHSSLWAFHLRGNHWFETLKSRRLWQTLLPKISAWRFTSIVNLAEIQDGKKTLQIDAQKFYRWHFPEGCDIFVIRPQNRLENKLI